MFSALGQGSLIYILDKTTTPKYMIGEVIGVSSLPGYNYNSVLPIDIKVKINGKEETFSSIPSNLSIVTYNNGRYVISETKQGLQSEVETILQHSRSILDNIDIYKQNVTQCEDILRQLNPQFAKDKERDDRLNSLETRFTGVEDRLDKIINLINK